MVISGKAKMPAGWHERARVAKLLQHDISLIAYHLPLDAHLELGNNARLAAMLGLEVAGQCGDQGLLWHGRWPQAAPHVPLPIMLAWCWDVKPCYWAMKIKG
jgi:putative NIF3 family GTP cyclohydrolase 1 type 2